MAPCEANDSDSSVSTESGAKINLTDEEIRLILNLRMAARRKEIDLEMLLQQEMPGCRPDESKPPGEEFTVEKQGPPPPPPTEGVCEGADNRYAKLYPSPAIRSATGRVNALVRGRTLSSVATSHCHTILGALLSVFALFSVVRINKSPLAPPAPPASFNFDAHEARLNRIQDLLGNATETLKDSIAPIVHVHGLSLDAAMLPTITTSTSNIIGRMQALSRDIAAVKKDVATHKHYGEIRLNGDDKECMDMRMDNAKVHTTDCHGGSNQKWYWDRHTKQIKNGHDGKCMEYNDEWDKNLYVSNCNGGSKQKWLWDGNRFKSGHDDSNCIATYKSQLYACYCRDVSEQKFTGITG